mmetsp:Transcript_58556/g.117200  ORF Transcript_58556/g.117200 Transcript_58556/m.117200 type:complete len:639 (+) Transcript_58556:3-1919(+)
MARMPSIPAMPAMSAMSAMHSGAPSEQQQPAPKKNSKVVKQLAAIDQSLKVEREHIKVPWIKTTQAHTVFGIVILANAVFIGVDVELGIEGFNWPMWITESIFLILFCVEISLRLAAERPHYRSFFDAWGCFDFAITLIGCVDAWVISLIFGSVEENALSSLNVLRMFRLVRLVRLVRVLRMFSELVVLVQTIGSSIMAVAWMSLLLFLVMYTGSIVTVLLIGQPYKVVDPDVDKFFGSLSNALFTHFCVVTLENWPEIADVAMRHNQWWAAYFVGFIVFTNFALVNLMVGVIVQRIILLSREQETELASFAAESDQFRITLQTLFNSMEFNPDNEVSRQDIRELMKRSETHEIMSAFGINLSIPVKTLYTIMDLDRDGSTTFQEFFEACIRLCGSQHSVHSVFVQHDICQCRHDLLHRMGRIERTVSCLRDGEQTLPSPHATSEAEVRELLERMDRLGQAQDQMLADLAHLSSMKERARARIEAKVGGNVGASNAGGPSEEKLGQRAGGAEARRAVGSREASPERKKVNTFGIAEDAAAGRASPSRFRSRAALPRGGGAGQVPPEASMAGLLHRTGQEIGTCCIAEPLFALPPSAPGRPVPEERPHSSPAAHPDLRAANRRELEAEYRSKRDVAFLS